MGRKDRRQNGEAGAWVGGRGGGAVGSVGTTLLQFSQLSRGSEVIS